MNDIIKTLEAIFDPKPKPRTSIQNANTLAALHLIAPKADRVTNTIYHSGETGNIEFVQYDLEYKTGRTAANCFIDASDCGARVMSFSYTMPGISYVTLMFDPHDDCALYKLLKASIEKREASNV